ncbi:MAG: helicase C-terminal domain-containing protein [Promethearchaeota archaeon]
MAPEKNFPGYPRQVLKNQHVVSHAVSETPPDQPAPRDFFPYPSFRPQQERVMNGLHDKLAERKHCLLVAPNGFGKTVTVLSAVFPLLARFEELDLRVVYCCRTHSQNARVIEELTSIRRHLEEAGQGGLAARVAGVSIRGRGELCLLKEVLEFRGSPKERMEACAQLRKNNACKYFNGLRAKKQLGYVKSLASRPVDAQELVQTCTTRKICPYFLIRDFLLKETPLVACNYQWIFNPEIRENFLKFVGGDLSRVLLVLDECHNLPNVATELDSDRLSTVALTRATNEALDHQAPARLSGFLKACHDVLRDEAKSGEPERLVDAMEVLRSLQREIAPAPLADTIFDLAQFGRNVQEEKLDLGLPPRSHCLRAAEFWQNWTRSARKESFAHVVVNAKSRRGDKISSFELVSLDPRSLTKEVLSGSFASLSVSGTIVPDHYAQLTGLKEDERGHHVHVVKSPFPRNNVAAWVVRGVSTRGNRRDPSMYDKITKLVGEALPCVPANAGVFCASYKVLAGLVDAGLERAVAAAGKRFFREVPGTSAKENAAMVEQFKSCATDGGAVLAGVCGGRNSEGEDFPGDFMNAVFVVGVPYSRPTPREEAKIKYFDAVFPGRGWMYAYMLPAFQRANQACGRPIRRVDDRGAIVLLDERFGEKANWLSPWIRPVLRQLSSEPGTLRRAVCGFFSRRREVCS